MKRRDFLLSLTAGAASSRLVKPETNLDFDLSTLPDLSAPSVNMAPDWKRTVLCVGTHQKFQEYCKTQGLVVLDQYRTMAVEQKPPLLSSWKEGLSRWISVQTYEQGTGFNNHVEVLFLHHPGYRKLFRVYLDLRSAYTPYDYEIWQWRRVQPKSINLLVNQRGIGSLVINGTSAEKVIGRTQLINKPHDTGPTLHFELLRREYVTGERHLSVRDWLESISIPETP